MAFANTLTDLLDDPAVTLSVGSTHFLVFRMIPTLNRVAWTVITCVSICQSISIIYASKSYSIYK